MDPPLEELETKPLSREAELELGAALRKEKETFCMTLLSCDRVFRDAIGTCIDQFNEKYPNAPEPVKLAEFQKDILEFHNAYELNSSDYERWIDSSLPESERIAAFRSLGCRRTRNAKNLLAFCEKYDLVLSDGFYSMEFEKLQNHYGKLRRAHDKLEATKSALYGTRLIDMEKKCLASLRESYGGLEEIVSETFESLQIIHELETKLAGANYGLVAMVVNQRIQGRKELREDLFQAGRLGLVKAIRRYDPSRGFKLDTYALSLIREEIDRCIEYSIGAARVPRKERRRVLNATSRLYSKLNRKPTVEEIAVHIGKSVDFVVKVLNALAIPVTIGPTTREERSKGVESYAPPAKDPSVFELVVKHEKEKRIEQAKERRLTRAEALIVNELIPVDGSIGKTQVELAQRLDVSRETVRCIRDKSYRKLANSEELRDYRRYYKPIARTDVK